METGKSMTLKGNVQEIIGETIAGILTIILLDLWEVREQIGKIPPVRKGAPDTVLITVSIGTSITTLQAALADPAPTGRIVPDAKEVRARV